jgi:uncharacterized membrane protein YqjE
MALSQTLARLGASLLVVASQRLELASLDFEEEFLRLGSLLAGTLVTALMVALALTGAAMCIVVYFWDTARLTALLCITGLFATAALIMAWRLSQALRDKPRFMASTLAQLGKDRAPLGRSS